MFLFTTPSSPPESPPPTRMMPGTAASGPVVQAIRDGAMASGVGFDYLLATARRESSLDPAAKAGTSSATGLFQFIEQTWLGVMKKAGPRLGLQAEADAITRQADGSYVVPDAGQRQAILDLRRDPKVSATLAGALTQQNADALSGALGREPTAGDLYVAHVLGAKGAAALIATARAFPARAAALDLPEAAAANRGLFYDRSGRPRSAAELYASLAAAARGAAATDLTGLRQDEAAPPQAVSAYASAATAFGGTSDLRSLFQTDARVAATDAAARNLQARNQAQPAAHAAPTYFPRTGAEPAAAAPVPDPVVTGALPEPVAPPPGSAIANPPLPPRRPPELAAANSPAGVRNSLSAPRRGP
ncbi:lytic transglycosylase domain-containing protein [Methylobacterium sp. E-005]|uniref:lytic transglycosylase domain-containing protein n=1 Tax=Methylobacterium sp. E-005 TaxID=2836549 RepID=UPI001FB868B0|nr:lytic transglycosylase domain-containing protein [Methylobacterium sp. E-005]MCJ2085308.1 lytic transglycosylase domain-containing protein [Methylobacterium sp. E-005]